MAEMQVNATPNSHLVSSESVTSIMQTVTALANTTHQTMLKNLTLTTDANMKVKERNVMSNRRYFMHFIGGWLLTAIFLFGISFLFITHFLGRREWRRYQQRLEEERKAVNHVIVDPKFMKYTKKGWKDIAFSL